MQPINICRHRQSGFSLLEMVLVLVIVTALLVMGMNYMRQRTLTLRIDRAALQMQQILNAGLAYYVANGKWPSTVYCLQAQTSSTDCKIAYLPPQVKSPLTTNGGGDYTLSSANGILIVCLGVSLAPTATIAGILVGKLPMAYSTSNISASSKPPCTNADAICYVSSSVNIPGQDLSHASAVNFAGVYTHGGCVPVPECPVTALGSPTPQIMMAPASVSGFGTTSTDAFSSGSTSPNVYPISSFTAYATGPGTTPPPCLDGFGMTCPAGSGSYWLTCVKLASGKGSSKFALTGGMTGMQLAHGVTLMAFTRCAIPNEPSGSPYVIFK